MLVTAEVSQLEMVQPRMEWRGMRGLTSKEIK